MVNFTLCLNWIWDKDSFPEYRRYLKSYGLSIRPPYRHQVENLLIGKQYEKLRDTPARQAGLRDFIQFVMENAEENDEKIYLLHQSNNEK
jgi:hypothetical protein